MVELAPLKLFYSYAHADEALRIELETHLALLVRDRVIDPWHDREITAGAEWAGEIRAHLEAADIVLLLVSANFLASDYCWDNEMKLALQRHERRVARVVPIILRPCEWEVAPFGKLSALPKHAQPVTTWHHRDDAFTDIARGIRRVVEVMRAGAR